MGQSKKWDVGLLTKYALAIVLGAILISCGSDEDRSVDTDIIDIPSTLGEEDAQSKAKIKFDKTEFDAGRIAQGDILNYEYAFENVGEGPLVISSVIGSCGCTIPKSYPRNKIMPGERGIIEVEFNSDNKWGNQVVTIAVTTNTLPSVTQLIIRTEIVAPDNSNSN